MRAGGQQHQGVLEFFAPFGMIKQKCPGLDFKMICNCNQLIHGGKTGAAKNFLDIAFICFNTGAEIAHQLND